MQADGLPLLSSNFVDLLEESSTLAAAYVEGGQEFQIGREVELSWLMNLILPIFITTVVIYSLSVICLIMSIVVVACILST